MTRPIHVLDTHEFAGTEQHVLTLAAAQARLGLSPAIACRAGTTFHDRAAALPGVGVVPLPGPFSSPAAVATLVRAAGRADLLHAHNGRSLLAAVIAGRLRRVPVVATQHFLDPAHAAVRGLKGAAAHLVHRACAAATAQTIAVSAAARDSLLARGEGRPDRVTVVLNGVADPSPLVRRWPAEVRRSLGLPPDALLVVCVARLEPEKGLDGLLRAMRDVPGATCVVAGRGSLHDALERQAVADGVADRVRLVGFRDDVPDLVHAADVFVLPSPAEPFGLALVEAMALGIPAVACRAGGPADIVDDGRTGLLVPPCDPTALAAAVSRLLADEPGRRLIGRAARAAYEARFTDDRMARQTAAVYDRALASRGAIRTAPAASS